jgi:glycosyltransferase involved in cell wall biosynthesis
LDTVFEVVPELKIKLVPCAGRAGFLLHASCHNLGHDAVIVDIIHLQLLLSLHNSVIYYAQADDVEYYDNKLMRMLVDTLYRIHLQSNTQIISMSQHLTDIFSDKYGYNNARTLQTGIDHRSFFPEPDEQLLRLKDNNRAIIFMARGDSYRKGYDLAMTVFESLDAGISDKMELWVCGDQLDPGMFSFTVRNFGVVNDSRLRQILSSADIFFYPSRHEGFGLFPLEAMACGCVAVTTDAIPYARQTPSIMVAPVGDTAALRNSLADLVTNDDLLADLRITALSDASFYDFEKSKSAFAGAVNRIVAGDDA